MYKYIFSVETLMEERNGDFNKLLALIKRSTPTLWGLATSILANKVTIFMKCGKMHNVLNSSFRFIVRSWSMFSIDSSYILYSCIPTLCPMANSCKYISSPIDLWTYCTFICGDKWTYGFIDWSIDNQWTIFFQKKKKLQFASTYCHEHNYVKIIFSSDAIQIQSLFSKVSYFALVKLR